MHSDPEAPKSQLIPRPELAFRVGIVGTRELAPDERDRVDRQLRRLLDLVRSTLDSNKPDWGYASTPPKYFAIDSLAEGTDQIGARAALDLGFEVVAPIPFDVTRYLDHFSVDADRHRRQFRELTGDERVRLVELRLADATDRQRDTGYRDAAKILMENSDVLIAVSRRDQEVKTGGTADTVNRALEQFIPVVKLDPAEKDGGELCTRTINTEQGRSRKLPWDELETALRDQVLNIVAPHREEARERIHGTSSQRLKREREKFQEAVEHRERFFEEHLSHPWRWKSLHRAIGRLFYSCCWKLCEGIGRIATRVERWWKDAGEVRPGRANEPDTQITETIETIRQDYARKFEWTDSLAIHYMELYRGAFVANFLLGALAVLSALLSYFHHVTWLSVEAVALILIATNFILERRNDWHARGLEYRFLAENFRQLLHLAPLCRRLPGPRLGAHNRYGDPNASWMNWYLNAVIRENGVIGRLNYSEENDSEHIALSRDYLRFMQDEIANNWLTAQSRYHELTARRFHFIHWFIHWSTAGLFIIVALIVALHALRVIGTALAAGTGEDDNNGVWTVLVAALPAFISALHSISIQGEFEKLTERSEEMRDFCANCADEIAALREEENVDSNFAMKLGNRTQRASLAMLEELAEWRLLYLTRSTALT